MGTLYSKDGSYFEGNFDENKKHGEGIMYLIDGDIYDEEWEHGTLIK